MKKLKILMVCGAGLGSSFACQMSLEDVLSKLGVEANLDHCDISSALSMRPDLILTASNFKSQFDQYSVDESATKIIFLKNIVSKQEIEERITPYLKEQGIL